MTQGERLAKVLEAANRRLVALLQSLSDEDWRLPAANAPGWSLGDDERRTIGQVALHTANQHLVQLEIVTGVAEARMPSPGNASNEEEAAANPDPERAEVLRLLEENCRTGAAGLRRLTDAQLATAKTFKGWTMTALELAEENQVGHVLWHLASIEATSSASTPRRPGAS